MTSVETVDLSGSDVADALDRALRTDGFVQVVGHGVDPTVAAALWDGMDDLFALPIDAKRRFVVDEPMANRGFRERGSESLSYAVGDGVDNPPDLFESFNCGHDNRSGSDRLMAPTPWPTDPPSFAATARRYLIEMERLSSRLDDVIGAIVGIDDLADRSRHGPDTMACLRYERRSDEAHPEPGQKRMGAHTDYTTFTILRADAVPGLEILTSDGQRHRWKSVVPEPDALLVNVGDLLAIWTDDAWRSTLHRVPLRGDGTDPRLRRSVAYFHYPDLDTVVEPLTQFRRTDSDYSRVTVRNHLAAQLVGPKTHAPSSGTSTLGNRTI